jgi:hypothetical protein
MFGFSGQYPVCSIVEAVEEFQILVHVRSCFWSKMKQGTSLTKNISFSRKKIMPRGSWGV